MISQTGDSEGDTFHLEMFCSCRLLGALCQCHSPRPYLSYDSFVHDVLFLGPQTGLHLAVILLGLPPGYWVILSGAITLDWNFRR